MTYNVLRYIVKRYYVPSIHVWKVSGVAYLIFWKFMHQSVIHLSQVGTYFRIDFCYNLSMVGSHCRILSPDKTEWRLISAILCGWRHCFVADQLWLMTCIREEEEWLPVWLSGSTLVSISEVDVSHVRLVLEHSDSPIRLGQIDSNRFVLLKIGHLIRPLHSPDQYAYSPILRRCICTAQCN